MFFKLVLIASTCKCISFNLFPNCNYVPRFYFNDIMYLGWFLMSLSIYDTTYLGCFSWHYIPGLFFDVTKYLGFFYDTTYLNCFSWHYIPGLFLRHYVPGSFFMTLWTWVFFLWHYVPEFFFNDITSLVFFYYIMYLGCFWWHCATPPGPSPPASVLSPAWGAGHCSDSASWGSVDTAPGIPWSLTGLS